MESKEYIQDINTTRPKKKKGKEKKAGAYKVKAVWGDRRHVLFVRICLEQMRLGNKPHNTLNKEGYKNLERDFLKETGLHYNKAQFKNHWDNTKRDWKTWNILKKSNEVGRDDKKNTFSQTPEWWDDFGKRFPGGLKFAEQPLTHVEELDLLFGSTGKCDMMLMRNSDDILRRCSTSLIDDDTMGEQSENSEDNETTTTPTGSTNILPSPICSGGHSSTPVGFTSFEETYQAYPIQCREGQPHLRRVEKRLKAPASPGLEVSLNQMCELFTKRKRMLLSSVTEDPTPILKAVDLLNEIVEIKRNSDIWLFAASLLRDQSTRELFFALGNPESRGAWIKREYRLADG